MSKEIASAFGALKRIKPFITLKTVLTVSQALIQPHFDYCCSVWDGLGEGLANKIQKLQNRAARVITRSRYDASAGIILDDLRVDHLALRRKKLKAIQMFKIIRENAPSYLENLFSIRGTGYTWQQCFGLYRFPFVT